MTRPLVFSSGEELVGNSSYDWNAYTDLPEWSTQILGIFLIIVAIWGVLGNLLIICVYMRYKKLRTVRSRIYISLAVADMMIALTMSPFAAVSSFTRHWYWGYSGCQWYGFAGYLFGVASMNSLAAISVERWLSICKPDYIKINLNRNTTHANITVAVIWLYSLFWAVMPFCGWSTYVLEPYNISCTINWFSSAIADVLFVVLSFVFVVALDVAIMIIAYSCICHKLYFQSNTTVLTPNGHQSKLGCLPPVNWEIRVTFISLLMVCSYMACWMPYCAVSIWASFNELSGMSMHVASIGPPLAKAACLFNPIIYAAYNKNFRKGAVRFLLCKKHIDDHAQMMSYRENNRDDDQTENDTTRQNICQINVVESISLNRRSDRHHGARILNWTADSHSSNTYLTAIDHTSSAAAAAGDWINHLTGKRDRVIPIDQQEIASV
ncbi:visual pigment-like receptor peropsin [Tubulanus polymorphus]|uniref:visual pigment-like receptor peropsin n=1 Tax=Tubulanus polymorphus TaxID=672921 RepID=UPI003DA1F7B6